MKFKKDFAGFLFLAYDACVILGLLLAFPPSLSFEAHAEPMTAVVARLAEATKTPLLCAPDVGRRRVIAVIEDAEPEEIRTKLAEAVGAEWVETQKGLRLEITPKRRSAALARHKKLREEWLRRAFAQIRPLNDGPWTAAVAKKALESPLRDVYGSTWLDMPGTRAARRILHATGASLLTDIEWGETRYFSTLPGGRYLTALPITARQVVDTLNAEAHSLEEVALENPNLAPLARTGSSFATGQTEQDRARIQVSDITLCFTRPAYGQYTGISVFTSTPAGTMPIRVDLPLQPDSPYDLNAGTPGPGPVLDLYKELAKIEVKPSEEVKKYLDYRTGRAKPPAEAPETFRNPERFEPLNLIYGEAAQALAKKKGWNVVFQVGDTDYLDQSSSQDASSLGKLFAADGENVSMASQWLVVGAKDQVETDRANLDRTAFGTYCRALISQGHDSPTTSLPLAKATGGLDGHPLVRMVRRALRLEQVSTEGIPSAATLLLLETLPARSFKGTVRDLNPPQRQALNAYLMGQPGIRFFNLTPVEGVNPLDRLETIPNVAHPNGFPDDLLFDLKIDDEEVAFRTPIPSAGIRYHWPLNERFMAVVPPPPGGASPQFRMGRQLSYALKLEAPGNRTFSMGLGLYTVDLSKKAVDFAGLPEDFRRRVEDAKKGQG